VAAASTRSVRAEESAGPPSGPDERPGTGVGRWDRALAVACWVVVALGVALRVRQWLADRSFWQDEDALWLAMRGEDLAGLARPLQLNQAAPVGWLWSEHGVMAALGDGERAARLLPLLLGCATLPLTVLLARRLLGPAAALAATVLVSFSPLLVYYSNEFKQYSADGFVALLLVLLGVRLAGRDAPSRRRLGALAGAAAVGVWFSHAAVLVAVGVLGGLGLLALLDRDRRRFGLLALTAVPPLVSVAVEYAVSLSKTVDNDGLRQFWADGFAPSPLHPGAFYHWAATSVPRLLDRPFGLGRVGLAEEVLVLALLGAGLLVLARRRGRELAVLLAPLVVLLAAAVAHAYPVSDRLVLFAVPTVLLVMAAPLDLLTPAAGRTGEPSRTGTLWRTAAAVLTVAGMAVVAAPTLRDAARNAVVPATNEETRPVVQYVAERLQPGDAVLVDTSRYPTDVYGPRFGLDPATVRVVAAPGPGCQRGLAEFRLRHRYRRVWLVYGHAFSQVPAITRDGYRAHLATIGHLADSIRTPGAGADLYDLIAPPDDPGRTDPVLRTPGATCLFVP
jgi:Dolichyl-phosphate-mannose-protein mannosyltransferase